MNPSFSSYWHVSHSFVIKLATAEEKKYNDFFFHFAKPATQQWPVIGKRQRKFDLRHRQNRKKQRKTNNKKKNLKKKLLSKVRINLKLEPIRNQNLCCVRFCFSFRLNSNFRQMTNYFSTSRQTLLYLIIITTVSLQFIGFKIFCNGSEISEHRESRLICI